MKTRKMNPLKRKANQQLTIIFKSTRKHELIRAFKELYSIVSGDISSIIFVFETSRSLLSTRDMQKIKEIHQPTHRWSYIHPYYSMLYTDLYKDLDPNGPVISNGKLEDGWI